MSLRLLGAALSHNLRQQSLPHFATILGPTPVILAKITGFVLRYANNERRGNEFRVPPRNEVVATAGVSHGDSLHHIPAIIRVARDASST